MDAIPLNRASSFIPFVHFLGGLGAPVDRLLGAEGLPRGVVSRPGDYIPTGKIWTFLDRMAREQDIPDLGLRVASSAGAGLMSSELRNRVRRAPSVLRAIQILSESARRESTRMSCWLTRSGDLLRYQLGRPFGLDVPGFAHTEWMGLCAMMAAVRAVAGPSWSPLEISLQAAGPVPSRAQEIFPNSRIRAGCESAWFSLHCSELGRRWDESNPSPRRPDDLSARADAPNGLADSISEILRSYLPDGHPGIGTIAEIAGVSVRSLQRSLSDAGVSYSDLVDDARLAAASTLLRNSDATSLEIAHELGYRDASNFSRAFRRMTGLSPHEFRRAHRVES